MQQSDALQKAQRGKPSPYRYLLDDPEIKRWFNNVARGSIITAEVYLRRVGFYCQARRISPKDLVKLDEAQLEDRLLDLVTEMEIAKYSPGYISSNITALTSWFYANHKKIDLKRIKIANADSTPTLENEQVPEVTDLGKCFRACDKKQRVEAVLIAHGGLRPQTLGDYKGVDGLRVCDLPEMKLESGKVIFKKIPTMVIVRKNLSKAKHQYFSFLSAEGCQYLSDYLERRMKKEELVLASPIVTPAFALKPFETTTNIGDSIREGIRTKAGFTWRPYLLRSFFNTQMLLSKSKGLIVEDYRVFWMGHKGNIESRYSTNKQKLPESLIEDMRSAYGRASSRFLQTIRTPEENEGVGAIRREILIALGFEEAKMDRLDLASMKSAEFGKLLKEKPAGATLTSQITVPKSQMKELQQAGYRFAGWFNSEEVIMNPPS